MAIYQNKPLIILFERYERTRDRYTQMLALVELMRPAYSNGSLHELEMERNFDAACHKVNALQMEMDILRSQLLEAMSQVEFVEVVR